MTRRKATRKSSARSLSRLPLQVPPVLWAPVSLQLTSVMSQSRLHPRLPPASNQHVRLNEKVPSLRSILHPDPSRKPSSRRLTLTLLCLVARLDQLATTPLRLPTALICLTDTAVAVAPPLLPTDRSWPVRSLLHLRLTCHPRLKVRRPRHPRRMSTRGLTAMLGQR